MLSLITWGGLWGIFEITMGYILHLLPFNVGWLVWYPVACFFMLNVYRKTKRTEAILVVGFLSASIKLLNLLLPGRIDRVLNPAVSIVFEALALAYVIYVARKLKEKNRNSLKNKVLAVLCMNTGWRVLYMIYILFLVPDWMREISVISSINSFVTFFFVHNLFTNLALLICFVVAKHLLRPIKVIEEKLSVLLSSLSKQTAAVTKAVLAVGLLSGSIALELLL